MAAESPRRKDNGEEKLNFKSQHYLPMKRWNSFVAAFRDESIELEIFGERLTSNGTKEVCGKAICAACSTYSKKQGIQIFVGFSGTFFLILFPC